MSLTQNLKLSLPKNHMSEEAVHLTVSSTHEYYNYDGPKLVMLLSDLDCPYYRCLTVTSNLGYGRTVPYPDV